jgi:hypothetical protein
MNYLLKTYSVRPAISSVEILSGGCASPARDYEFVSEPFYARVYINSPENAGDITIKVSTGIDSRGANGKVLNLGSISGRHLICVPDLS